MVFRPEPQSGRHAGAGGRGGSVEFRLARNAVVAEFLKGRLSRAEVCDAHPELLRAARNCATPTAQECPVCEVDQVVMVTYVFGPGLPAGGRCVTTLAQMARLNRRSTVLAGYVVEVCPGCGWNHLARSHPVGGRRGA